MLGLLHAAFLDRLGAERYHLAHRVVRVDDAGPGVVVRLRDGTSTDGAIAVGVDGIHLPSAQLYPDEGPVLWNGQTLWRGTVWAPPFLTGRSMVVVGHFGKRASPIRSASRADGLVLTNVVFEAQTAGRPMPRQDWDHTADPDDARTRFETFRFDWLDLAALIDAPVWWQYPMADRDPLPQWSFGRVTLMGDAAHPMYPV